MVITQFYRCFYSLVDYSSLEFTIQCLNYKSNYLWIVVMSGDGILTLYQWVVDSINYVRKTVIGCKKKPGTALVLGLRPHSKCNYYRISPTSALVKLKLISFTLNFARRNVGVGAGVVLWREGLM